MRSYSAHLDPARPGCVPVLVPDGFSFWGLVLGWIALARPGSWLAASLAGTASVLLGLAVRAAPALWPLLPGLHLVVGLFAHDWRRWELQLGGLVPGPVVAGTGHGAALLRLLSERPDLSGRAA